VGLGRDFTRLWAAYAISAIGSAVATDAFALIAVLVLSSSVLQVSLLSALGGAVGAVLALPLGPWIEFRHKRPVMIAADVGRFVILLTIPVAYAMHGLTYTHLAVVSVLVAMGQIAFLGASGPHLRALVVPDRLTEANGRFESVQWTSSAVGPPAGGLLMSALGPCVTVIVDASSYLLSAVGVRSIRAPEPEPPSRTPGRARWREIGEGWRHVFSDGTLRLLFVNTVSVSALIIAMSPVLAVMMLRELHFSPFQYGVSVGVPCVAGVVGARLSRRFARRGKRHVLLGAGVTRVLWLPWLPLVGTGWLGLAAVTVIHTGTVFFMSLFNPVFATCRIERTRHDRLARVLTAWSISNNVARAACTLLWGLLATLTAPRIALGVGAALLLLSVASLPWTAALDEPSTSVKAS
jgi:Major Facilitator Superfamily